MPRSSSSAMCCHPLHFLLLAAILSSAHSSLPTTNNNKPSQFGSNLALIGDAKFTNDHDSCVQLTHPKFSSPSSGFLLQKKPLRLLTPSHAKSRSKPVSFSTDFTFSISPHDGGDGLAFVVVPRSFPQKTISGGNFGVAMEDRFFMVEFDTLIDANFGDVNANHVGLNVGSLASVKTSNVSSLNLVLNSGLKLHSWIDYDSSSKSIEIRLSKSGNSRPYSPLLVYRFDLGEMWRNEEVLVGLSSSSRNSMQTSSVYSWKFKTRVIPDSLHSQPLDPRGFSSGKKSAQKKTCAFGILSGLVFMAGFVALLGLIVLFLWALFENSSETILTIPTNCKARLGDFRYEKINVVVGDQDGKN